ncbi:TRAP transporter substrate-binding protein DctP [Ruegeria sp. Ofav3-42]|uniref:TRAP transporter substrate-binding protein DctP n=1 Tax=Ruegeria sp. Ofav3-42 TaxID=2917759 RepID=UPI001EF5C4C4|nr:TRAP transporter substrate-binding protein DctP [Ruegeria sp. Ofav3-42]MCG7522520.1 TRAP transporter substrate-binding protein DctP [Ruegeria sp. Ofav3-42]
MTLKLTRRAVMAAATAVSMGLTAFAASAADTTLRLSHLSPPDSDMDVWANEFASRVAKETDGRIEVRIFPASQLGDWEEVYEQLSQGSVDLAIQSVSTKFDSRLALTWFPYTAVDYDSAKEAWNTGGFLFNIVNDLIEPQQIQALAPYAFGLGGVAVGKPVTDPKNPNADHSDLKIRVWPSGVGTHKPLLERLGYSTTTMPWAELYTGVQTGVIDGMIGGVPENAVRDWNGVVDTWLQLNDHFEINWLLGSAFSMANLSDEDRATLSKIAAEMATERFDAVEAADNGYLQQLRDEGVTVVTYSKDEIEAMAAVVRADAWPEMKPEIGDELYELIQQHYGN